MWWRFLFCLSLSVASAPILTRMLDASKSPVINLVDVTVIALGIIIAIISSVYAIRGKIGNPKSSDS